MIGRRIVIKILEAALIDHPIKGGLFICKEDIMQKIKIFTLTNTFPITQEEVDNEVNQYIAMIYNDGHKVINVNVDIKYIDDSCT
jgi:hypothetical protein